MEPHELAIAALNEFADSSSHRYKTATTKLNSRAPGNRIRDTVMRQNGAESQEPSQYLRGTDKMSGDSQEFTGDGILRRQSMLNSSSTVEGPDTPPTSTSDGFSSQSTNNDGHLSQLSQLAAAAAPVANLSALPNLTTAPSNGLKRTADGHVKPTVLSPTSIHGNEVRGHSRNTSAVSAASTGSKIGELSSELRTRLSYAMVKVNNGWQSNSIDEVESLASQAGSPTSSSSTRRNLVASPRTNMASLQSQAPNSIMQTPAQDFDLYSRSDPPSRTYESFWRDHSTSIPAQRSSNTLSHKLSLQPPPDIQPAPSSRRSHTPKFTKPPAIPGQGSNSSLNTSTPRTPNGRAEYMDTKSIQTPTQTTIDEQEVMEALIFMSSPGNSGNMGPAFPPPRRQMSPQQSPLRAEFHTQPPLRVAQGRRVEFEKATTSTSTGSSEAGGYAAKAKVKAIRRAKSEAIDRLLDEMGSSSEEEELVLNYQSPRRVAAGRV